MYLLTISLKILNSNPFHSRMKRILEPFSSYTCLPSRVPKHQRTRDTEAEPADDIENGSLCSSRPAAGTSRHS